MRDRLISVSASDTAALVKQAVDIVDVIGQVVPLRRTGKKYTGICPFHPEKTPSFQVDPENQLYYCFGCGSGGDVLSFIMRQQNLVFGDAIRYLADRYHINLPRKDPSSNLSPEALASVRKERDRLYAVMELAGDYFHQNLVHARTGRDARDYLKNRAVPEELIRREKLGYAPPQWDSLARYLRKSGVNPEIAVTAGLLSKSSKNPDQLYDRFRNRIIFPIRDERDRVVAFGGRILGGSAPDEPKYLNSPETPIYQKGRMLYQMARAREACRRERKIVLVEGYMDLLAFHAHGFERVAATLGTALTPPQVRLLARAADEVILAYDGDEAGERAMLRALPLCLQDNLAVSFLQFPDGMDPDDFLRANGASSLEALMNTRQDLGLCAIRKALKGWDGRTSTKAQIISDLAPIFEALHQPVLRSEYLRVISEGLALPESVIERQLRHGRSHPARWASPVAPVSPCPLPESREEKILQLLIHHPEVLEQVRSSGAADCFREPRVRKAVQVLLDLPPNRLASLKSSELYDLFADPDLRQLVTRLVMESADLEEPIVQLRDWLDALTRRSLKEERRRLKEALAQAETAGDATQVRRILLQIQKLGSVSNSVKHSPDNV
ncbi:MAG TPA: DNA primase [Syntrophobacteraceae bacterium]|nr:DNA primase [Syntrophobacteraceae bacterium]